MIYSFGEYQLDENRREVRCSGNLVKLRPKVFDVLLFLIQQRDRVVSKDDLLAQVWAGRYVSETTLSSSIKELRKALNDTNREKRYVKTLHATGFRFVAEVTASATAISHPPSTPAVPQETPARSENNLSEQTASAGERKSISAIRCALLNADELVETIGPENLHNVMQDLFKLSQDAVTRYDGQVTQWLSDGFLALFGVPIAHEDHARRALSAAVQLQDSANTHWRDSPVSILLGMTSGTVIVGGVPGQPHHCFTASGRIMRLAETLCYEATPDHVLVCQDSYDLLRAEVEANPRKEGVGGWQIEHFATPSAGVPRRSRHDDSPLVGRDWEMSLIQQRLERAADGSGQVVALSGQAGIGKSRLLSEFQIRQQSTVGSCIKVHCYPQSRGTPFFTVSQCLRQHCAINDNDPDQVVELKLSEALERAKIERHTALPLLMRVLNLHSSKSVSSQLSNKARREQTFSVLQQLFLSRGELTILIVEDLHWMDDSSAIWLASLVNQLNNHPLFLITSARPGHEENWSSLPWVTQLILPPLTSNYCRELLHTLPLTAKFQQSIPELVDLSGGNPFYLGELALNSAVGAGSIPKTIQGVLTARIDQLSEVDKNLLQLASIAGQCGSLPLLIALSELDSTQINASMLRLQAAELLFSDFEDGNQRFVFRHALIQEVAYNNQLDAQRQSIHACIATTTREQFPQLCAEQPEFLAFHYTHALAFSDACRFWQRAAQIALHRSAYVETIAYVLRGCEALKHVEPSTKKSMLELLLLRSLGDAQVATLGYGSLEVQQTWNRAIVLCESLKDDTSLFRILTGLSNFHLVRCDFKQAFSCNRRLFQLSRKLANKNLLIMAQAARGELLMHYGRLDLAKHYLEICLSLIEQNQELQIANQGSAITATAQAAWVYWYLGDQTAALSHADQSVKIARQLNQPFSLTVALSLCAELHRLREDPVLAMDYAHEAVDLSAQHAFPYWQGSALVTHGWAIAHKGDTADGIDTIKHGLKVFKSTGASLQISSHLEGLADAQRVAGEINQAITTTNNAIEWAQKSGDKHRMPRLLSLQKLLEQSVHGLSTTKTPS